MLKLLIFTTGFSETLCSQWEKYLTKKSRESIKKVVKKDDDGLPIFNERVGLGILDDVNTLIYTIIKHFVGTIYIYIFLLFYKHNKFHRNLRYLVISHTPNPLQGKIIIQIRKRDYTIWFITTHVKLLQLKKKECCKIFLRLENFMIHA